MRKRSFFFHYNKPATLRRGRPTISVHWHGACHLVDNVVAMVSTVGKIRKTAPRFVMSGVASSMEVIGGVAVLK